MLTDEVIDEDIEALLYAQVYYGKSDNTEDNINLLETQQEPDDNSKQDVTDDSKSPKDNNSLGSEHNKSSTFRFDEQQDRAECLEELADLSCTQSLLDLDIPNYLGDQQINHIELTQQPAIEISTSSLVNLPDQSSTDLVTQVPLLSPSNNQQQLVNKITINQYIYPGPEFLSRLKLYRDHIIWSRQCEKDLKRYQKGKLNEEDFFKTLQRRVNYQKYKFRKQEKIRKAFFKRRQEIAASEVICLSDSDNSDIEIIDGDMECNRSLPLSSVESSNEDDDEIIYVPPPPVPIVNVDDESDSEKESIDTPLDVEQQQKPSQEADDASNDFLAPTKSSENFNFSLHGSEFQDAEFVRPANPHDTYETESSTSTSEFNRDSSREFVNSAKTIVFNEVDFPKEDIFEGSNLEKFGELIAPNRVSDMADKNEGNNSKSPRSRKKANLTRTVSESSSESDYGGLEVHQNLPDLSPMVSVELSPRKSRRNKANKKEKSGGNFCEENDGILDVETSGNVEGEPASVRAGKRRRSETPVEHVAHKKKAKKKKKKSSNKGAGDADIASKDQVTSEQNTGFNSPETPSADNSELSSNQPESPKKKEKKKRRRLKDVEEMATNDDSGVSAEYVAVNVESTSTIKLKLKKKKDAKAGNATKQTNTRSKTRDNVIESIVQSERDKVGDSGKKKGKKNKQRLPPDSNDDAANDVLVVEESLVTTIVEDQQESSEHIENVENQKTLEEAIEEGEIVDSPEPQEPCRGERVTVETQVEDDIILIEQVIPVHTIESSESDDDIVTFDDVGDELELANISECLEEPSLSLPRYLAKEPDEFDIEYIQSKMSDDPDKWKILSTDRFNLTVSKKGPRCNRCRQFGHIAINCPSKPSVPTCTLCGYEGHQEPRCPNRVCFICARPSSFSTVFCYKCADQRKSTCRLCKLKGHSDEYCPDLWRRYHLTTKEGPLVKPKPKTRYLKRRGQRWCSGCAGKGHLEPQCDSYKWIREYPVSSTLVYRYQDVYEKHGRGTFASSVSQQRRQPAPVVSQPKNIDENAARPEAPSEARDELEAGRVEAQAVDSIPKTAQSQAIELPPVNSIVEPPPVDPAVIPIEPPRQEESTHQPIPPATEALYFPRPRQQTYSQRRGKRSRYNPKVNPVSMLRGPDMFTRYTPYQSMLNPCPMPGDNNKIPTAEFGVNNPSRLAYELYNSVPTDVLTQQIANLMNSVQACQRPNDWNGQYEFSRNENNYSQFNSQQIDPTISFEPPARNYWDYSGPLPNERYFDYGPAQRDYGNRDYLNVPYTITREPSQDLSYNNYRPATPHEDFRRRDDAHPPEPSYNPRDFLALTPARHENIDSFRSRKLRNVEEVIAKKFIHSSVDDLSTFLSSEIEKLNKLYSSDPKVYKKKLNHVDQLQKIEIKTMSIKKQIYKLYNHLNMFLFGVQRLDEGKQSLDFLRDFVRNPGTFLSDGQRTALLEAYGYIFGGEHPNCNYRRHLNALCVGPRRGKYAPC